MGTTGSFTSTRARSLRFVAFVLALALAGFIAPSAQRASATPAQHWLGLSALQTRLNTAPDGLPGHFKTVVGGPTAAQQAPVDLPLTVLGVIPDAGVAGSLLLVRLDLTDPVMARIGNIASGMSGSPVYLEDGVVDKLVGALSYGDIFTTDGLALATPVEDMMKVEDYGLTSLAAAALQATPRQIPEVRVNGRTISTMVLGAPNQRAATSETSAPADSDTAYFTPLLGLQIGGLPVTSPAYKRLAKDAAAHGLPVLKPRGGGPGGHAFDFQTPVVPGASAGTFFSLGDVSAGAIGTVTYTTGSSGALAFGHPLLWNGRTAAYFTNAWIDGVWSSTLGSYKLGSPGSVRGTLVQDRGAAVGARLDAGPTSTPVTASATVRVDGREVTQSGETQVAPVTFSTDLRSDLVAAAVVAPVYRAADVAALPGSARTDLWVDLSDGTHDYTVHRTNLFDEDYDVQGAPASEVYRVLETLLGDLKGLAPPTITSVRMTSDVTSARARAEILSVASPGLHVGRNTLKVAVKPLGSAEEQELPVTLTIPAGTPLTGTVTVAAGSDEGDLTEADYASVASRVAALNNEPTNAGLIVTYEPRSAEDGDESDDDGEDKDGEGTGAAVDSVRTIARTSYVVSGSARAATSQTVVGRSASPIVAGQTLRLSGTVSPAAGGDTVKVERRTAGTTTWRTMYPALRLSVDDEGLGSFAFSDRPQATSGYRVTYGGSRGVSLGSSGSTSVAVRGSVRIGSARTKSGFILTASVAPRTAGATITFQRAYRGHWRTIKAVKTSAAGLVRHTWKVRKGSYRVRAVLTGTTSLAGNVSPTIRVTRR